MPPILEVRGLSKSFGGLHAVAAVDFSVAAQGILGIAGPNGSGKSTLFNVLTRIPFGADHGVVLFEGREIQSLRAHAIARLGVARTFQRESVFPGLSVIDNVLLAVENSNTTARFPRRVAQAQRSLEEVGFPATLHNSPAGQLPIFLRKLVMIASALALQPRLLLLDEPASSLTAQEIERIKQLILQLKAGGMTILLIEHVLPLLTSVSDQLMVLDQGRVIARGNPAQVIADPLVVEAYLGRKP